MTLEMWSAPSRSMIPPWGCSWDLRDLEDLAALALLGAGQDDDFVVLLDVEFSLRVARLVDAIKSHG
jgi:hypothetical protein